MPTFTASVAVSSFDSYSKHFVEHCAASSATPSTFITPKNTTLPPPAPGGASSTTISTAKAIQDFRQIALKLVRWAYGAPAAAQVCKEVCRRAKKTVAVAELEAQPSTKWCNTVGAVFSEDIRNKDDPQHRDVSSD